MAGIDVPKFARLAERLEADPTPTSTAEDVIGCLRVQLEVDHASITMIHSDRVLETIAPSSPIAEELDRLQYELGEGPCYDSAWHGPTLRSAELASDPRWPRWGPRAAALGVTSILATELVTSEGRRIGALNGYWSHARRLTEDEVTIVEIIARHAALALATAWDETQLGVVLSGRKLIGRAEGVLMERYGVDADRAYEVLRRFSQDHDIKLRDVAAHLIHTRELPTTDSSP